ncbi:mitochondrial ribosome-associated GTPase 1 isoform X2 [Strigops habroptila]|uniref:mitochondrial ribosome-associated GTPase 1 isoform X2 n=1 Tax=Strigops habroptila TaxID=2489341 RepID=UPI0011CF6691|nr:mitochondrial ribosome-associated GTPase 1 isoform X2 [Strigops habroptila]
MRRRTAMRGCAALLRAAAAGPGPGGFRERFDFGGRDVATWFPGHMAKGLRQMRASLRRADCLIEVHDARIPLSGRNPILHEVLGIRPHILVLNKMDLADPGQQPTVLEHLKQQRCSHVVFADCQRDVNVKKIVPLVAKLVDNSPRYHRAESTEYSILVIGVPNVGKSSLINSLRRLHLKKGISPWRLALGRSLCWDRVSLACLTVVSPKGKATAVGGEPGVTKAVLTRIQVCEKPLMYLVDTPGVLSPKLGDVETGMKLALCGAIRDHLVGEDIMADYLLYALNKRQQFRYVQRYGLADACDDIELVLRHVALTKGRMQKVKVLTGTGNVNMMMLNYPAAAYEFLRDFRAGRLGRVTLD